MKVNESPCKNQIMPTWQNREKSHICMYIYYGHIMGIFYINKNMYNKYTYKY